MQSYPKMRNLKHYEASLGFGFIFYKNKKRPNPIA
jgi:hypothetical protein